MLFKALAGKTLQYPVALDIEDRKHCFYRQEQANRIGEARVGYHRPAWVQADAVHLYELQGSLSGYDQAGCL